MPKIKTIIAMIKIWLQLDKFARCFLILTEIAFIHVVESRNFY